MSYRLAKRLTLRRSRTAMARLVQAIKGERAVQKFFRRLVSVRESEISGEPDRAMVPTHWPNDITERLNKLTVDVARYRNEARFRQMIGVVMARYFIKGERADWVAIPYEKVTGDSNPRWIPELLERRDLHEPEFSIFRYFADDSSTILDIGANWGYAAASIWAAETTSRIISFEPNPWHMPCLQRIKELRPGLFDFVNVGLGSRLSDTKFVIPVLEGLALSALASASIEAMTDWGVPENILHHLMHEHAELEEPRIQFTEVVWRTDRLDDVLDKHQFDLDLSVISAMKIDVEGFEADVLTGAEQTLRKHKPMIMIEGANRVPAIVDYLSSLGYRFAEFVAGCVELSDQQSSRVNGFFLNEEKLVDYRTKGMLRP
jgi:FkbM family methyltransferase